MLPTHVSLVDVGPRDGLQNEAQPVAAATKIALVHRLQDAGLRAIEVTSFVSPKCKTSKIFKIIVFLQVVNSVCFVIL